MAVNLKAASASLSRAIIKSHHPNVERVITTPPGNGNGTAYPVGKNADNTRWHGLCPRVESKDRDQVVLVVRDPIERFRSACAEVGIADVDELLSRLESGTEPNQHFASQSRFATLNPTLYRFETDLEQLAEDLNLEWPMPNITRQKPNPKPDLTSDQVARVAQIYADDILMHESI